MTAQSPNNHRPSLDPNLNGAPTMSLNREQFRFLNSRLESLKTEKQSAARRSNIIPVSSAERKARKVLDAIERRRHKLADRAREKINQQYAIARQAILFKDAKEAQAIVEKFARFKP